MAFLWNRVFLVSLIFLASFEFLLADDEDDDGAALLEIKKSFRDIDNVLYEWVDSSDPCYWRGVTCDNVTFNVIALNLSGLNLVGEISPSIGRLKGLLSFDLSGNHLSGQIPDEIGDCSALKGLDLSFNAIEGDIPFSISKLKQLETLVLKNNLLTGPIPSTLSQIPNLKSLDLAHNMLSGDIPRLIYWNEVLQYLGLRENNLTGSLSPDMCQLTGLWYFDVRNNSITGNIPQNIGNCTSFQVLDLSYNQLTGEIPFNIGFLQVATLSLQGNKLTGNVPSVIGLMQALAVLDLSCNLLSGPIPPILGNLTYTEKLYLHGNKLTGFIPPELGNMSMLHYLELNDNKLSGRIPPELGKLTDLFELNVASNYLQGPIPDNLGSCTNLNNLDLSNNKISGSIPSSVGDLEHLLKLNLSKNRLTGYIPAEFGNLRSVMEIDLSYNLLSGQIPQELGQLQNLFSLRLEKNNLTGDLLPLGNCFSLNVLNVSYNNLVGDIPSGNKFSRFPQNSFIGNPALCGSWLDSPCHSSHSTERASISKAAILGIALGALVILLMILVAVCRPHNPPTFSETSLDKPVHHISPKLVILDMNMALHVYEDIMRMTENLSEKYIIGYGASSTVYKCVLKSCRPVAIKRLYSHFPQSIKEFETELETVGSIKHRNLVSLQGYSLSPSGNLLFYDYMENGSLWDLLHGPSKKQKLDWNTRIKIALGAAQGLTYLHHDCSPRIIHRDVKSSNILLDRDFEAHLTDFGIAKSLCTSKLYTSTYVMGTIGYIDPEYARTSRLTEKSDVYSYGIVLLELLTGKKAVDNESNLHHLIMSKTANNAVMETVDPDVSETCKDLGAVKKVFQLALLCSKRQPSDRPTMHEVTRVLESLVPVVTPKQGNPSLAPPSTKIASYMEEYSNIRNPGLINCSSMSTSDAQLFLKFGEVISQNTE
ncbi:non-specific serine/threonine protein kinase [Ranunculus cassubicifolius]